jgi:membrane protein DedA with SNARE-associated domain
MSLTQFIVFEFVCLCIIFAGSFSLIYKLMGTPISVEDETYQMKVSFIVAIVITVICIALMIADFPPLESFN